MQSNIIKYFLISIINFVYLCTIPFMVFFAVGYVREVLVPNLYITSTLSLVIIMVVLAIWLLASIALIRVNKKEYQENKKFIWIIGISFLVFLVLVIYIGSFPAKTWYGDYVYNKKYPTKETVVHTYLEFVTSGNKEGLREITPPYYIIDEVVEEKIKLYNGKKPENLQITYTPSDIMSFMKVSIDGTTTNHLGENIVFHDEITIERIAPFDALPGAPYDSIPLESSKGKLYVMMGFFPRGPFDEPPPMPIRSIPSRY